MKKSIFLLFLTLTLGASVSMAQTKKRPTVKRAAIKRATVKKTSTPAKKTAATTVKKMTNNTTNSAAVTTESSLTYIITKNGDGAAVKSGDEVIVNYTGMLTNGQKFDSSLDRNEPFSFPVGAGMVIKGWDEGLQKLRVGDHAILTIPASIGYGARGAGGIIPPNATLIFIIEVLGVK